MNIKEVEIKTVLYYAQNGKCKKIYSLRALITNVTGSILALFSKSFLQFLENISSSLSSTTCSIRFY